MISSPLRVHYHLTFVLGRLRQISFPLFTYTEAPAGYRLHYLKPGAALHNKLFEHMFHQQGSYLSLYTTPQRRFITSKIREKIERYR